MSRVLVSSSSQRTDALAQLGYNNLTHTSCAFAWKNTSAASATYRLTYRASSTSTWTSTPQVSVGGAAAKTLYLTGLKVNQAYYVKLERPENGSWISQTSTNGGKSYLLVTTHPLTTNDSTSSNAAVLKLMKRYAATYKIQIYAANPSSGANPIQTFQQSSVTLSGSWYSLVVKSLKNNFTYYAVVSANEAVNSAGSKSFVPIKQFAFETSSRVSLSVVSTFATHVNLAWDGTDAGNDEEDSTAEFSIQYWERVNNSWSFRATIMNWTPDTTKTFKVTGLTPGKRYLLRLNRKGVHGTGTYQDQRDVTTKTTNMVVDEISSTIAKISWEDMCEGSLFQLVHRGEGEAPVVFGGGSFSGTNATITGLTPGKNHEFKLYVVEDGALVGTSTLALGSSVSVKTGGVIKYGAIGGTLSMVALLVILLIVRMRKY